jgi:flagellar assembly protein FliH
MYMSNTHLPKEQQTAYQRWEMSTLFSDDASQAKRTEKAPSPAAEKLASMLETTRKEAYLKGKQDGRQQGYLEGLQKGQEVSGAAEQKFLELSASFRESLNQADEKMANDLLKLALDIAKSMIKTTLSVDSTKIIPIVKEAIHYLPSVQQPARIMLHPEDAITVREHIGEELREGGWHIIEDDHVEQGGCMIETASNQIDASNATRWKRISKALGQPGEWGEEVPGEQAV